MHPSITIFLGEDCILISSPFFYTDMGMILSVVLGGYKYYGYVTTWLDYEISVGIDTGDIIEVLGSTHIFQSTN